MPKSIDFSKTKTFSAKDRVNLVRIDNLRTPCAAEDNLFHSEEFDTLVAKLEEARRGKKTVILFYGAHTKDLLNVDDADTSQFNKILNIYSHFTSVAKHIFNFFR